jgi:hypothetical protein
MAQGWIVVLESAYPSGRELELEHVEALLAKLADRYPSALYAPDRCAVQFVVGGIGPDDALSAGIALWRDAVRSTRFPEGELVRTEVKTPAELASEYEHPDTVPTPGPADEQALASAYEATRKLLRVTSEREAVSVLQALVRKLGGTVLPARPGDPRILDLDVSLGEGAPMMPAADPYSVARLCLEEVMPDAVEDALLVTSLLRAATPTEALAPSDAALLDSDLP